VRCLTIAIVLFAPEYETRASASQEWPFEMVVRDRVDTGGQPFASFFLPETEELLVLNTRGYVQKVDLATRSVVARSPHMIRGIMQAQLTPDRQQLLTWSTVGSKVYVIDTLTLDIKARVSCGKNLGTAVLAQDGRYALVSSVQAHRVCIIDMEALEVVHRIPFPRAIGFLAVSPRGDLASASAGIFQYGRSSSPRGSHIFLFDPRPGQDPRVLEAGSLVSGRHPRGALFDGSGDWLMTANRLSGDVSVTQVGRAMVTQSIPSGKRAEVLYSFDGGERFAVANRGDDTITLIDMESSGPVHAGDVHLSGAPHSVAPLPDGRFALVTILGEVLAIPAVIWYRGRSISFSFGEGVRVAHARYRHGLSLVDLERGEELDFMKTGDGPVDVSVHPDGTMAAVSCARRGSIDLVY